MSYSWKEPKWEPEPGQCLACGALLAEEHAPGCKAELDRRIDEALDKPLTRPRPAAERHAAIARELRETVGLP